MHDWAISTDSVSSALRVPSLRELERKSIIAKASRFLDSCADAYIVIRPWIIRDGVDYHFSRN